MANDDWQVEKYLRRFCPLEPDPLPSSLAETKGLDWPRRLACAAATVLLIGTGIWLDAHKQSLPQARSITADEAASSQPLTIRRANALLFESSSIGDGLDEISFSQNPPIPVGRRSALSILGEEKTKI